MKNMMHPVGITNKLSLSIIACASLTWLVGCECECFDNLTQSFRVSATTQDAGEASADTSEPVQAYVIEIDPMVDGDADLTLVQATTQSASASR